MSTRIAHFLQGAARHLLIHQIVLGQKDAPAGDAVAPAVGDDDRLGPLVPARRVHRHHAAQAFPQVTMRHRLEQIGCESELFEFLGAAEAVGGREQHQTRALEALIVRDPAAEVETIAPRHHVVEHGDIERRLAVQRAPRAPEARRPHDRRRSASSSDASAAGSAPCGSLRCRRPPAPAGPRAVRDRRGGCPTRRADALKRAVNQNSEPTPSALSTPVSPSISSTRRRTIDNPRPVPP